MKRSSWSILVLAAFTFLPFSAEAGFFDDLKKSTGMKEATRAGDLLCPPGRECVLVDEFIKKDNRGEVKEYKLSHLTSGRGYDQIVVDVEIREETAVIVNTVKVDNGGGGRWATFKQARRLNAGRNELAVPIPAGTAGIMISFDHGKGSKVRLTLESVGIAAVPVPPANGGAVLLDTFIKAPGQGNRNFQIGSLTEGAGFSRVIIEVQPGQSKPLFLEKVGVFEGGRETAAARGLVMSAGRNTVPLNVHRKATELRFSFKRGRGSQVRILVER